ncbi:MAG: alcohol dehydrogenase, partial [Verrucomicrobiota bacterium]
MKNIVFPFLACAPLLASPVHAANWPQYRGASGNGIASETMDWKASGLRTVWKVPSLGGFSSFVVADGRAFTLSLREIDGASQEVLVAHNASSGA